MVKGFYDNIEKFFYAAYSEDIVDDYILSIKGKRKNNISILSDKTIRNYGKYIIDYIDNMDLNSLEFETTQTIQDLKESIIEKKGGKKGYKFTHEGTIIIFILSWVSIGVTAYTPLQNRTCPIKAYGSSQHIHSSIE